MKVNELKALVADFQTTRLDDDQMKMVGFEGQGRAVLYNQLAEAYRIAKLLLTKGPNRGAFQSMMEAAGMTVEAKKFEDDKATNEWAYATKLLYGKFVEKEFLNTVFQEFEPNRSAERYGCILRHLNKHNIAVEAAADYMANFTHEKGNALFGIEAVDRAEAKGEGNSKDEKQEQTYLNFGVSPAPNDVVQFEVPADWYDDKRFKSDNQFGTCWFEVKDGRVLLFDRKPLKEDDFKKLATARGKRLYAEHKATQKTLDNVAKASNRKLDAAEKIRAGDKDLAVIKTGVVGTTTAEYRNMLNALGGEAKQDAANAMEHRQYFTDLAGGKLGVDPLKSIVLIKSASEQLPSEEIAA
ncbi:MAG: hypothetical protein BGP16_11770 [Sphingobium sp. 66-54]|nr:MAG: hypothetical protein BGP16_11770 [Sphingobium sp. 66-54]